MKFDDEIVRIPEAVFVPAAQLEAESLKLRPNCTVLQNEPTLRRDTAAALQNPLTLPSVFRKLEERTINPQ